MADSLDEMTDGWLTRLLMVVDVVVFVLLNGVKSPSPPFSIYTPSG
jgi:hypothetical protein